MSKILLTVLTSVLIIIAIFGGLYAYFEVNHTDEVLMPSKSVTSNETEVKKVKKTEIKLPKPPSSKVLNNAYHIFQTFNNCGPASLSMALSYYKINVSQQELGQSLRPYQNPQGDNDDKSTTLAELAEKSKEYGLVPYHRPNGNIEIVKNLIANDIPVVTRTWLKPNDDIGHYRVIKGYDDSRKVFIQDDSLQGKNLEYTYDNFFTIWKPFGFEYLAMAPKNKTEIVEAILGDNVDEEFAWNQALETWKSEVKKNPDDVNARFNMSVVLYYLNRYEESVAEFEKVEDRLPSRALWYQIEPIQSYYELKDYDRVFSITDKILSNNNKAFSELYLIRGNIYKQQGNISKAKEEYQKAVIYNKSQKIFSDALNSI